MAASRRPGRRRIKREIASDPTSKGQNESDSQQNQPQESAPNGQNQNKENQYNGNTKVNELNRQDPSSMDEKKENSGPKVPNYTHNIDLEDDEVIEIPDPSIRQQQQRQTTLQQKSEQVHKSSLNQATNLQHSDNIDKSTYNHNNSQDAKIEKRNEAKNYSDHNPPHSTPKTDPSIPSEAILETKNGHSRSKIDSKLKVNGDSTNKASPDEHNKSQISFARHLFSLDNYTTNNDCSEDTYSFFKRSIAKNALDESNVEDLLDSESDPSHKRLIKWRVRGILSYLQAFDIYNRLTAKGFQVIRVKVQTQSEKRAYSMKKDDPMFDILQGNNRALQIEEGYHSFSGDNFFKEIFRLFQRFLTKQLHERKASINYWRLGLTQVRPNLKTKT